MNLITRTLVLLEITCREVRAPQVLDGSLIVDLVSDEESPCKDLLMPYASARGQCKLMCPNIIWHACSLPTMSAMIATPKGEALLKTLKGCKPNMTILDPPEPPESTHIRTPPTPEG